MIHNQMSKPEVRIVTAHIKDLMETVSTTAAWRLSIEDRTWTSEHSKLAFPLLRNKCPAENIQRNRENFAERL